MKQKSETFWEGESPTLVDFGALGSIDKFVT